MKKSIIILTGGGPAPGINAVVATVAKTFLSEGYRVLGVHGGYRGLFIPDPHIVEFDFLLADAIFNKGGSYLMMSRYKPTQNDYSKNFNLRLFRENNICLLVTIGGDDTATTAGTITKFLADHQYPVKNIHVPKTIDNDLPLPQNLPTFGFYSAAATGTSIATTIYEDAKSSGSWFVVAAMGRSAGHLAFEIGMASHYPMIVIPEMFNKTKISVDKIINLAVSSIIKRKIRGLEYGAVMVSEGVFHQLDHEELVAEGINFTYDEHGHPELGKVSKAQMFNDILEKRLKELHLSAKTRPVEIGYEVRCSIPIAFDLAYCSQLGTGVYQLFIKDYTGCMVYANQLGDVGPLFLKDIQDPETGKIPPRGVDIHTDKVQAVFRYMMNYITPADYESARQYVEHPEDYDFQKILNW